MTFPELLRFSKHLYLICKYGNSALNLSKKSSIDILLDFVEKSKVYEPKSKVNSEVFNSGRHCLTQKLSK